ncbi:MAG: hypothetical protein CFE21_06900 [Bacteroidetes bacterium B1(2017)]|nr:MAG: hypothetical protein CFE21_06900 [Bacteroidetes bacterium B1(2017)]
MKKRAAIFLSFTLLLLAGCGQGDDGCCYDYDPCSYKSFDRKGDAIAYLGLDTANQNWVPEFIGSATIPFKKVNSTAEISYLRSGFDRPYYTINVRNRITRDSACKRDVYTRDYANCSFESFKYTGSPGAKLELSVKRLVVPGPYVMGTVFDSINFYKSYEVLKVTFSNLEFSFNPRNFVNTQTQIFHPSITFENVRYDSVYELLKPNADTTYIIPQGIYYSCKEGVVGMYLTNKAEVWYKK